MNALYDLSCEQEKKIDEVRNFWDNFLTPGKTNIDPTKAEKSIEWLYRKIETTSTYDTWVHNEKPIIIFGGSPLGCQMVAYILKNTKLDDNSHGPAYSKKEKEELISSMLERVSESANELVESGTTDAVINDIMHGVLDKTINAIKLVILPELQASNQNYLHYNINTGYLFEPREFTRHVIEFYGENRLLKNNLYFANSLVNVSDSIIEIVSKKLGLATKISRGQKYSSFPPLSISFDNQNEVSFIIRKIVAENLRNNELKYTEFSGISNSVNYGKFSFYDFFNKIGLVKSEIFDSYKDLFLSGIYEMIVLQDFCIVGDLPIRIRKNDGGKLHCDNGPAISWNDGYELYFWNGINVPKNWIVNKDKIRRKTIISEQNSELRRCIMEIIGIEKFIKIMDLSCIDEDVDNYNKPIRLFRTNEKDEQINNYLYYLYVICPSTDREYFLSVKPTNKVWRAKAQTFRNKKINFRQGDVGLINKNESRDVVIIET